MTNLHKKHTKKTIIFFVCFIVIISLYFFYSNSKKDTLSSCEIVNPETDIKKGLTQEQCAKDEKCFLAGYLSIESMQEDILSKMGSDVKSIDELKKEGIDVFDPTTYTKDVKQEKYETILETLTHGEATIPNEAYSFSDDEFNTFNKDSVQREPVQFLRKTLDDYIANKPINILSEGITKKCHIVYDEKIGLDGFSKNYFKSRFVPLAIYRHISSGYDIFIFFVDKPDKLFRVWVGYDKNSDFQLKMIKDAGIPKEEIDALNKAFSKAVKDKRFSL